MNQNSTKAPTVQDSIQHSKPIPISTQHLRPRSPSSSESSNSPTSSPCLLTPNLPTTRFPASSSSPILYFLSQSPSKAPSTFPFRGFAPPPVLEDEPTEEATPSTHARRASTNTIGRFQSQPTVTETHHERGVNVLRRLSLSHIGKPPVADIPRPSSPRAPPNSAVSNPPAMPNILPKRKTRRSATIVGQTRPRRAPSPMGERILKGHFDGFN